MSADGQAEAVGRRPLRVLEVAALPFPTAQGTQALLREQCEALARRGNEIHLLVYAHGAAPYDPPLPNLVLHRVSDWPRERSLRSGPSWRKVVLDWRLIFEIRRLETRLRPDVIHAHNYEALVASLAARRTSPLAYHAHTLFGHELPTFAKGPIARMAFGASGHAADRLLPRRADLTLAVSPRLVSELRALGHPGDRIECSLPGIAIPNGMNLDVADETGDEVIGYSGNLDSYQGLPTMLDAVAILAPQRPRLKLRVVTTSETAELREAARRKGLGERLQCVEGASFRRVLDVIRTSSVCVVPRSTPGGFPVKLLTYLAAGRPVVATRCGAADLELGEVVSVVDDDDASAMARAISWLLDNWSEAERRGRLALSVAKTDFSWDLRSEQLEDQLRRAARTRDGRPSS